MWVFISVFKYLCIVFSIFSIFQILPALTWQNFQ